MTEELKGNSSDREVLVQIKTILGQYGSSIYRIAQNPRYLPHPCENKYFKHVIKQAAFCFDWDLDSPPKQHEHPFRNYSDVLAENGDLSENERLH
jgi:hypothetical protein